MYRISLLCLGFVASIICSSATADVLLLPQQVELHGPKATQQLILQNFSDGRFGKQITTEVSLKSSDDRVVRVEGNRLVPVSNGQAEILAWSHGESAKTTVTVAGFDEKQAWEFRRHVLPILSKAGCNTGACHGALAGKGGFKLSLRAYDPAGDYLAITRSARGRRIELADPGRSLLLAKPTAALPHKGGLKIVVDSNDYKVLAEWIQAGVPAPKADDAQLDQLEVFPPLTTLGKGDAQQLLVRATYSDGRQEDVTKWTEFSSTNETVLKVDDAGRLSVIGHGEGAIVAWFSSQIVLARVASPFNNTVPDHVFAQTQRNNFIDEHILEKLKSLHLKPSPISGDSEFVRRVYLDTIGTLPTEEEASRFLTDPTPDKRNRLIDELLGRTEYVDYWTHKWSDLFLINGRRLRPKAVKAYYQWLRGHVERNSAWDTLVREVVTAKGSSLENGATNFYALHQDPENMTENVCQAFLGLSITCAKCHNHPLEKWTNNQYYAMANMFSRVKAKGWGGDGRSGDGARTLFATQQGEL
ncbi:DUF1549 domain-containing protein, partial [Planctomycetota bacterium]